MAAYGSGRYGRGRYGISEDGEEPEPSPITIGGSHINRRVAAHLDPKKKREKATFVTWPDGIIPVGEIDDEAQVEELLVLI
jgi:hypothetical protein